MSRSDSGLLLGIPGSLLLSMFLFIITCHLIIGLMFNVSVQTRAAVSLSSFLPFIGGMTIIIRIGGLHEIRGSVIGFGPGASPPMQLIVGHSALKLCEW